MLNSCDAYEITTVVGFWHPDTGVARKQLSLSVLRSSFVNINVVPIIQRLRCRIRNIFAVVGCTVLLHYLFIDTNVAHSQT